jgi:hypothetical protein
MFKDLGMQVCQVVLPGIKQILMMMTGHFLGADQEAD